MFHLSPTHPGVDYIHGVVGVLYFKDSKISTFGVDATFDDLNEVRINGKVYLFSCSGGAGGRNSVAFRLAEKTHSPVRACTGHVSYSELNGKYYARKALDFGIWMDFYHLENPINKKNSIEIAIIGGTNEQYKDVDCLNSYIAYTDINYSGIEE